MNTVRLTFTSHDVAVDAHTFENEIVEGPPGASLVTSKLVVTEHEIPSYTRPNDTYPKTMRRVTLYCVWQLPAASE